MKRSIRYLFLFLFLITVSQGCSVQKRQFRKGYTINFSSHKKELEKPEKKEDFKLNPTALASNSRLTDQQIKVDLQSVIPQEEYLASVTEKGEKKELTQKEISKKGRLHSLSLNKCDTIKLLTGEVIVATVKSESSKEILYQLCGKETGSKFFLRLSEIESIHYYDGRFRQVNEPKISKVEPGMQQNRGGEDRSQILALVLAILVGSIGAHRFYLGHYAIGVLYVLTGGLCLIGVIVDIILILTGDLQPKNGAYYDDIF
jgi:TM2 domain-containing membrane protein YozV